MNKIAYHLVTGMIIRAGWSNASLGGILAIVTHDLNKLNPRQPNRGWTHQHLALISYTPTKQACKRSSWKEKCIPTRSILLKVSSLWFFEGCYQRLPSREPALFPGGTVACFKKSEWHQRGPYPAKIPRLAPLSSLHLIEVLFWWFFCWCQVSVVLQVQCKYVRSREV